MTKAEAIEVMDGLAAGAPFEYGADLREAAEVAVKALRRSLGATKRAKKNAIRRRKEARK